MASVNKVILIGNLGKDPEVRYTQGGQAVATFSIACNDTWTDKSGQRQERTEWVRIVAWGKTAELAGEYLQKGRQVYVEGRLQTREWTDKENRKQWTTEVVASQLTFLGGRPEGAGQGGGYQQGSGYGSQPQGGGYGSQPQGGGYGSQPQSGGQGGQGGEYGREDYGQPPSGYDGGRGGGGPSDDDIPF